MREAGEIFVRKGMIIMKKHGKHYLALFLFVAGFVIFGQTGCAARKPVQLTQTRMTMVAGKMKRLKLKQVKNKDVKWSTSNKKVLAVDEKGQVYALKSGSAYVKAKYKNHVYKCKVTVIGFNKQKLTMAHGDKYTLKLRNAKVVRWYSKNTKVAKVSSKGVVKGKKTGKTTVVCVTSSGRKIKCKVYVASLSNAATEAVIGTSYKVEVRNTGNSCTWSSSAPSVASVSADGTVNALQKGKTTIRCKTGKAVLSYKLEVINPNNIVTEKVSLPTDTNVTNLTVTINSYPTNKTYTICRQDGDGNKSSMFKHYMQASGCSASSLGCVLSAYAGFTEKPKYLVETVERELFGDSWTRNYTNSRPMPISLYGMTQILDYYHVGYKLVRDFDDVSALTEIENHLKTGNPVIFIVDNESRFDGLKNKWTTGYHCMTMLGMTDTNEVIVADTVNRSTSIFGKNQRIKYASLYELLGYMFPCTNTTSTSLYWSGKGSSGGYILINPQG